MTIFTYNTPAYKCSECGCEFQSMKQLEISLNRGNKMADDVRNPLTPEKIESSKVLKKYLIS